MFIFAALKHKKDVMTQLTLKGKIDQNQMDIVLGMLRLFHIEAEIVKYQTYPSVSDSRLQAVRRAKGILHTYANSSLVEQEKSAWAEHLADKFKKI